MTTLFDGMAGLLNGVFGGPVLWLPASGGERRITAVFRREPVEVEASDGGSVIIHEPTLRAPEGILAGIERGDLIEPGNGRQYRVTHRIAGASPAADRMVTVALEEVTC